MALFPFCKASSAGPIRVSRIQLVLCCFLLSLIIYYLHGSRAAVRVHPAHPIFRPLEMEGGRKVTHIAVLKGAESQTPAETPWGAPLVWGDSRHSASRRAKFAQREIRIGLLAFVVGTYAQFIRRFLYSAETYFLPGQVVTYYILTDNPRSLDPPVKLGPEREMKVIPIAELPGWERLAHRRMTLLGDAIRESIDSETDYIFCADVDQEFVAPVRAEILGDLVATLHPELYGMPRNAFPYEVDEGSSAYVEEDEGDFYYTSEFYGGAVSEMYKLARGCSLLILQDHTDGITARGLEESYLNRYLIDHRPTCVLSPEYSWWDSDLSAHVPVHRLLSLGRQCESYNDKQREEHKC
ncbi:globoside alpha-1,3-N-acetylgalactosaminyltransferase 1 isoform X1 [Oreochromis niloticus]|uniref:globoside alpha-1,3-N-acetylgalactosaminyltransferase 1 isoform X1 n=2 Tax=Oreochromis niloticus TaxID=8128 RepID=UPI0003946E2A|nr:globoside alpha-1,3-N-acetylgalactosaminyltransferase 1 isoform X1 [Oreochromis niloticus]